MDYSFFRRMSHKICLGCANVSSMTKKGGCYVCCNCGHTVSWRLYKQLVCSAANCAYYGYLYREAYEKQLRAQKKITTYYALPEPSVLLVFCALAALSGIVGNASYDFVKKIVKRLAVELKDKTMLKEAKVTRFYESIEQYCRQSSTVDVRVREAIAHEEYVWTLTHARIKLYELDITKLSEEDRAKVTANALKEAIALAESQKLPDDKNFKGWWSNFQDD